MSAFHWVSQHFHDGLSNLVGKTGNTRRLFVPVFWGFALISEISGTFFVIVERSQGLVGVLYVICKLGLWKCVILEGCFTFVGSDVGKYILQTSWNTTSRDLGLFGSWRSQLASHVYVNNKCLPKDIILHWCSSIWWQSHNMSQTKICQKKYSAK